MDDDQIINVILKYEGGFVNNPADHGGATNFGITAADLGRWRSLGRSASVDEVRTMTVDEARQIYKAWYIVARGLDAIANSYLKCVLVDTGVLHGTRTAIKWLQQALGIVIDGVVGNQTTTALTAAAPSGVAARAGDPDQPLRRHRRRRIEPAPVSARLVEPCYRHSRRRLRGISWDEQIALLTPASKVLASALAGANAKLALRMLGCALLGDEDATIESLVASLKGDDPDKLLKVLRAECDFQRVAGDIDVTRLQAGCQDSEKARQALIQMETVSANDRANARQRQQVTNDRTNAYLAYIVTVGFLLTVLLVARYQSIGKDNAVLQPLLGILGTGWASLMAFYFGSSVGSREKTALLGEAGVPSRSTTLAVPATGGETR